MVTLLTAISSIFTTPLLRIGGSVISLATILQVLAVLLVVLTLTLIVKRLLTRVILKQLGLRQGTRESIATISSYGVGVLLAIALLQAVGINLASLAVVAGSLGIGIGFGLQDIVRNFISGITLLVERQLEVGDFIEWQGLSGYVAEISLRSTVIRTITERYIIVPNSNLVGDKVINWTYHHTKGWVSLPIQVAHESDPVAVIEVLMDSAYLEETVSHERAPEVYFVGFSEYSLDFQLWVWVTQIDRKYITESSLRFIVEQNLRQHGIKLASPRLDLWHRNPNLVVQSSLERYPHHVTLQAPFPDEMAGGSLKRPVSTRDLLRQISYFQNCSEIELRKLVEVGSRRHLKMGETLYQAGDPGNAFYIILAGALSYTVDGLNHAPTVLTTSEFIGEFSLMLGIPRTVTVHAIEDTTVFAVSPQGFKKILKDQPQLYELIVQAMGRHQEELSQHRLQLRHMGLLNTTEYDKNPVAWITKNLEKLFNLSNDVTPPTHP
ncbi:Small Conductance Mechanosensitive Ion Channel [Halomicronema hongdechloris C2206]|uniref:Small Conductance Mechanosensitive Ion Channel n=1 Tax=Halomicronema hongdechloris C2206 TaxID=1641165 RepID=A0A1Z3HV72_9CYAN|nr:mechanosensitive ion channel domain-containing protein [Halomicronema hongdechloris]ASC74176.1 Small Conductance Mechanosensitive Ion Channel [Halomicronema hongdechloris C2206]